MPTSTAPLCSVGAYFTLLNHAANKLHVVVLLSFWKINKLSLKRLTFIFSKFDVILSLLQVSFAIFYTTMLNVAFMPVPFMANLLHSFKTAINHFWSIKSHRVCLCVVMHSVCNLLSAFLKPQFLTIVVALLNILFC